MRHPYLLVLHGHHGDNVNVQWAMMLHGGQSRCTEASLDGGVFGGNSRNNVYYIDNTGLLPPNLYLFSENYHLLVLNLYIVSSRIGIQFWNGGSTVKSM